MWVWDQPDLETFLTFADRINLRGVTENITVPFLITHGENDRQIPLDMARECFTEAVNSPQRS